MKKPLKQKIRRTKLKRFWKEWGVTLEQVEVFLASICIISVPLLIRIFFSLFGF